MFVSICFLQYLDNILQNPTEEKFRKIRKSNKAFQERVASQEGTDMFLEACGFKTQSLEGEDFWVYSSQIDSETIQMVKVFVKLILPTEVLTLRNKAHLTLCW